MDGNFVLTLSVVIVNWNTREHLEQCLYSISKHLKDVRYEIVVVDNNSSDGSPEMVRKDFPEVNLVCNRENAGFSAACNQAAELAKGEFILFLGPDVVIGNGTVRELLKFAESNPNAMAGALLRLPTGQFQLGSAGNILTERRAFNHYFFLSRVCQRLFPGIWLYSKQFRRPKEVEWLSGACMLLRSAHFKKADGFDERFFIYAEDMDLCKRLAAHGVKFHLLPQASVVHDQGAAVRKDDSTGYGIEAQYEYCIKHLGREGARRVMFYAWLGLGIRGLVFGILSFTMDKRLKEHALRLTGHAEKSRQLMKKPV